MKILISQETGQVQGGCCEKALIITPLAFSGLYIAYEKIAKNSISLGNLLLAAGMGLAFALMSKLDKDQRKT
jgi:hypothetical protein